MHIQLMEIILENLWKFLFVAVSCLFCECPQKIFKKEEKAHLKQPTMDTHLLYFFRRSLDPLHLFLLPLQLESNRIGCQLGHSFYTCLLLILLLSRLLFVFWTVSYPAHWNQTFTIQDHISGRKRLFLHYLVSISPNRP